MVVLAPSAAATASEIKKLLQEVDDDREDAVRLDELRKIFARLVQSGELDLYSSSSMDSSMNGATTTSTARQTAGQKWHKFLVQSHREMVIQLTARIRSGKRAILRIFWGVVATCPRISAYGHRVVANDLVLHLVKSLTATTLNLDKGLCSMLNEFFQYRDVQYYLLGAIVAHADALYKKEKSNESKKRRAVQEAGQQHHMLLELLCLVPVAKTQDDLDDALYLFPPEEGAELGPEDEEHSDSSNEGGDDSDSDDNEASSDTENDVGKRLASNRSEPPSKKQRKEQTILFSFQRARSHHSALSKAWLAVLRLDLDLPSLKQALLYLPNHVLSLVPSPLLFADFFMSAYNHQGVVPILALDGLFLLMTQHRLEYPDFYKQLYRILTPQLLFVKYRSRFSQLLDKCLRNELLPAHIVAAFVKRLCRCAMSAPPSAALFVLALCSNLIRKHPEIACLVHRKQGVDFADGFDPTADDPEQANALDSSLWELQILERHYLSPVATLAKSLGQPGEMNAPLYNLDDFVGHTYKTLTEQERKRRLKGGTPVTFSEPQGLLVNDLFSEILETS